MASPLLDPIQALWVGSRLSNLEKLSLASFVANGHTVHLYAYEDIDGVPAGVTMLDGREILPESAIFSYGPEADFAEGSLAAFANLFRYKLLYERGGWWIDADMVCLKPFDMDSSYVFGCEYAETINCAVMRVPRGSRLASSLYEAASAKGRSVRFGDTGPKLLSAKVAEFGLERFVLPSRTFYPIYAWAVAALFQSDADGSRYTKLHDAYGVHFWNEMLRQGGTDKDGSFPVTSIYERLKAQYGIA